MDNVDGQDLNTLKREFSWNSKAGFLNEYERSTVILKEWAKYEFHSELIEMIMCFLL